MTLDPLESAFASIAACPVCQTELTLEPTGDLICSRCGRAYPRLDGIWRFLLPDQQARYQAFLDTYRVIRRGDGWERYDDAYYLNLPEVSRDDPQAPIWNIRRRTFDILKKRLIYDPQSWVLDLGAGNCWLSRHLALADYHVLALDVNVEGRDGLAGGEVYLSRKICSFLRGQASMDCLPVRDEQIALCVISGALHYVHVQKTLQSVFRVLKRGGQLIVMDSPVYHHRPSGLQMRQEQLARFKSQYGLDEVPTQGAGYLVLDEMLSLLKQVGFSPSVCWPNHLGSRIAHRIIEQTTRRRETACFPVFVNTKPLS